MSQLGTNPVNMSSENLEDSSNSGQWQGEIKNTHQSFEKSGFKQVADMSGDFTEGKYGASMAMYCGTIRNSEAGFKPIRSNSVDSDLHLQTGGWMSKGKAFLQSSLNLPLKKTCFVKSTEGGQQSVAGWVLDNNHFYHLFDGSRKQAASHVRGYSVKLDWAEIETEGGHPTLDTLQLKIKLKRRMSEILPQKGPFETILPLKPALARSASQRLLNATRPVPPIERSASSQSNGAHDKDLPGTDKNKEPSAGESPGSPCTEVGVGHAKPATVPEEVKISLQHLRSSAEKKRKLLGASLSQSFKLPSSVGSNFQLLPSRLVQPEAQTQTLHVTMSPLERHTVTQGLSTGPEEQDPQPPADSKDDSATELKKDKKRRNRVKSAPLPEGETSQEDTSSPQTRNHLITARHCPVQSAPSVGENKSKGSSLSQTTIISFKLSTELGPDVSRQEPVEDEETENEGRLCHVTISKSAQEKMCQKRREEVEQRQQQKERELTQQLRNRLQDVSLPVPELLNSREFSKISLDSSGFSNGSSLRKRINRPSLPSIPNITQMYNVPRHFSAHSLPGFPLDSPEGDEESDEEEFLEMSSFSRQEQGLTEALKLLANNDWEMKRKGLSSVRRLARFHPEQLLARLHAVCLAVTKEVNNLRSKVARSAILSLSELFSQLKRNMDQEVDEVSRILLHRTGDSNEFIREEAVKALAVMAKNVSPSRALTALIAGGLNHRNTTVRKCTAENLLCVVEHLGAERLLLGTKDNIEQIVQTVVKFSQDGNQETRFYGRKALNILVSHPEFERYLERSLLSQDLHHIITAIKQRYLESAGLGCERQANLKAKSSPNLASYIISKGLGAASSDPYSPKDRRSRVNSSSNSQENILNSGRGELDMPRQPKLMARRVIVRSVESVEQVKQLNKLLSAKEFQERMQGISLLLQHCETNPRFVTANVVNIFDAFIPRLQDSNKKVNQFALQSMATMIPVLKDDLHRVLHSTVTVVTDNLNSKNTGIYTAAVHVLDTLIDQIDNLLLLQPFASRVQFVSGQAMQVITERLAALVLPVYHRKPQAVERHVLPVLWYLLNNMTGSGVIKGGSGNVRVVTAKLAASLHQQMGAGLQEYASSQPAHVIKTLRELTGKEL